jgi:branched-chain amino acid transport system permease protein
VVLDVDLRQPDEEPRVLPEAHGSMSAAAHPALPRSVRRTPRHVPLAVLGAAAFLPLFVTDGGIALHNMILAAAYVIMALGLNIVVGFAGLLDLGYVAFFAIGAHVAAHFGSQFWEHAHVSILAGKPAADLPGIHLNFLLILVVAIAVCTLAGVLIGVPTLRLRGDYIGIVTLAFGEIIGEAVTNGREIHFLGGYLTGGPNGMSGVDRIDLPFLGRFGLLDLRPWYWFALVLVAVVLVVNFRLRDSRLGRAWLALRDDEVAAASAGIPIMRTKLLAYGVGAAMGGVSGAFLASYLSFVDPKQFTFSFSILILAMVVLGGMGSIWGVVVGAVVLSVLNNYLLPKVLYDVPSKVGLDFNLSEISSGIYGLLLVMIMLLRPEGLLPARRPTM